MEPTDHQVWKLLNRLKSLLVLLLDATITFLYKLDKLAELIGEHKTK